MIFQCFGAVWLKDVYIAEGGWDVRNGCIWRYTDFPSGGYRHQEARIVGGGSGGQSRDREKSTGGGSRRLHGSRRDKDRGYRDEGLYDSYDNDPMSDRP